MTRRDDARSRHAEIVHLSDAELEQRITDTAAHAHRNKRFDRLVFERERRRRWAIGMGD
jgi:hypothetical protein